MSAQDEARRLLERQAIELAARSGGTRVHLPYLKASGPAAQLIVYNAQRQAGAGPATAFSAAFRSQARKVMGWLLAFAFLGGAMLLAAWMAAHESLGA